MNHARPKATRLRNDSKQYSTRRSRSEYSPMFTEPEVNNCFSIILRGEYQGLQNNGLKHENAHPILRVHTCLQP